MGFSKEMQRALESDGQKLKAMTGEEHGPVFDGAKKLTPIQEIRAERKRQIEVEGWTTEHDDAHDDGAMLRAAVIYYQHAARPDFPLVLREDGAPMGWPWDAQWWKPKDARRDLIRAGALCVAEKDRIRRSRARIEHRKYQNRPVTHVEHKLRLIVQALERLTVNPTVEK